MTQEASITHSESWWQRLLDSKFAQTIGTAIATILATIIVDWLNQAYQAHRIGVPTNQVDKALAQEEAFSKNASCLKNLKLQTISGGGNTSISVGICPGRILAVLETPHDTKSQPIFKLISWAEADKEQSASLFISSAMAQEVLASYQVAQADMTILCQKPLGEGLLLIRVKNADGQCVEQTVNTYTGAVVSTIPVNCDSTCA